MKRMSGAVWVTAALMMLCGTAWGLTIWVALQVSTIVLDTLHQIVELAGMGGGK